jgi:NAD(P)-dependent dehydrogenase (short-subunit alcohol dehydrogenase family)
MGQVRFSDEHIAAFAEVSRDRNPLHCDVGYARRTQFGVVVVHGMAAVVLALARWSAGRPFRLRTLDARFRRPLLADVEYELSVTSDGGATTATYRRGGTVHAEVVFSAERDGPWSDDLGPGGQHPEEALAPEMPSDGGSLELRSEPYEPDAHALPRFERLFGLERTQLPSAQLRALLWSSYYVGMRYPGRQALFVDASFMFVGPQPGAFAPSDLRLSFDARLGLATLTGRGPSVGAFQLRAFHRPEPVRTTVAEVEAIVGRSARYRGRTVLVTGSGRGFGAALAMAFAICGARVAVNARTQESASDVARAIAEGGGDALATPGDVREADACRAIAAAIRTRFGGLDMLVNSASPVIGPLGHLEQSVAELEEFVGRSLRAYVVPTRTMLPLLRPGATIVNISTGYLMRPRPLFTHYLAAKGAIEGLTRGMAVEHRDVRFVIARPPRMLTDQTNIPFDREPRASTAAIAGQLIGLLSALPADTGVTHELDLA